LRVKTDDYTKKFASFGWFFVLEQKRGLENQFVREEIFMNQENSDFTDQNTNEWQAPPLPEQLVQTEDQTPRMSEAATLGNIFFSPSETFEDLRRKPRFVLALLLMLAALTAYQFLFMQKMGEDRMRSSIAEQMDKSSWTQSMTPEQKQQAIESSVNTSAYTRYLLPLIFLIVFAIGGLIYWLAGKVMGGEGNYRHGISAWVYSSFPPTIVATLANILILFLKSADDIDMATSQSGLIHANPSFFLDGKTMPVLATLIGTLDLFQIWGWVLAAIGLQKLLKLSKASAWSIVLILALASLAFRIIGAFFSGNPM